jgi:hypothetical protein
MFKINFNASTFFFCILQNGIFYMRHAQQKVILGNFMNSVECLSAIFKQEFQGKTNHIPSLIRHGLHRKRRFQQFTSAGTSLLSCCLVMKRGRRFTEPLPSNDIRDTYTDTHTEGRDL